MVVVIGGFVVGVGIGHSGNPNLAATAVHLTQRRKVRRWTARLDMRRIIGYIKRGLDDGRKAILADEVGAGGVFVWRSDGGGG